MNKRNTRLSRNFHSGTEYYSSKDNRSVTISRNADGSITVEALLHNNAIAKETILPNGQSALRINQAGWPGPTTTSAIKALLPRGWGLARGVLTTPKGIYLPLVASGWTLVKEPTEAQIRAIFGTKIPPKSCYITPSP